MIVTLLVSLVNPRDRNTIDDENSSVPLADPMIGLMFDIFVFALTVKKTRDHAKQMKSMGCRSITQTLFHDGER